MITQNAVSKEQAKIVYLNDNYISENDATISIFDRGFLFADGVYEVIPVYNGQILFLQEHLDRLQKNLSALKINYALDYSHWANICQKLINHNGQDCPLYIQITRGNENTRNHDYSDAITPTVVAYSLAPAQLGSSLTTSPIKVITRADNRWNHCDVKSIALLGNILLRQEGKREQAEEVLLVRENGHIVEGTASNYFIVKNNVIITPPLTHEILPGITRKIILELCKAHGIPLLEQDINLNDLLASDEVWLSSSTKEIRPVGIVNQTIINNGKPGSVWNKVANLYINNIKQILHGKK